MLRISLFKVNVVLWALIVVLVVVFAGQLRWAQDDFPDYVRGKIGAPIERNIYRKARRLVKDRRQLELAHQMLKQSLAIDPTCEAGYWLAEYYVAVGDDEAARDQFERYLEIDPMMPEAWIGAVNANERSGKITEARRIAVEGAEYFDALARASTPVPNRRVREKFDDKAREVFNRYRAAKLWLSERADELAATSAE